MFSGTGADEKPRALRSIVGIGRGLFIDQSQARPMPDLDGEMQ